MSKIKNLLDPTIFLNCMRFPTYSLLDDVLEGNISQFGEDFLKVRFTQRALLKCEKSTQNCTDSWKILPASSE